jgi:ankyrin repeat protein
LPLIASSRQVLAQLLLSSRADVRATDENQQTVLHHAARAGGDALCFEMLLRSYAASTSEPGNPGAAEAAETAETASVAEVRAEAPETGIGRVSSHTGTHSHSHVDHEACGRLDKWGRLPLHWAIVNGHRDAMVALVEAGSNVWLRDFQHQSSMDLAEERAMCREWLNGSGNDGGRCDQLTLSMLKLMAGGADAATAVRCETKV